jgi:two-component system NtrC family sensor kinase
MVHLDYGDTGQGMDEAVVEKLFEPFFTTRRARGGTGLGMYICYNIVTSRLKGTIACESSPGMGTQFHITFPVEKIGGEHA